MGKITRKSDGSFTVHGSNGISGNLPSNKVRTGPQSVPDAPKLLTTRQEPATSAAPTSGLPGQPQPEQIMRADPRHPVREKYESTLLQMACIRRDYSGVCVAETSFRKMEAQEPGTIDAWASDPSPKERMAAIAYGYEQLSREQRNALAADENYFVRYTYAKFMWQDGRDPRREALILDDDAPTAVAALSARPNLYEWTPKTEAELTAIDKLSRAPGAAERAFAARFTTDKKTLTILATAGEDAVRQAARRNRLYRTLGRGTRLFASINNLLES